MFGASPNPQSSSSSVESDQDRKERSTRLNRPIGLTRLPFLTPPHLTQADTIDPCTITRTPPPLATTGVKNPLSCKPSENIPNVLVLQLRETE